MKNVLILLFISIEALSQRAFIQKNKEILDIDAKKNGRCKYSRNSLNKAQLNNIYKTDLKHNVKDISKESISRNFRCIFLTRNLRRDSNRNKILKTNKKRELKKDTFVDGKIRYLATFNKKYSYKISKRKKEVTVNIYFSPGVKLKKRQVETKSKTVDSKEIIKEMISKINNYKEALDQKLNIAAHIWSYYSGGRINFNFNRVSEKSNANFIVKIVDKKTRGPYDTVWSTKWSAKVIAHEIGHMMGLDDEYDNFSFSLLRDINKLLMTNKNRTSLKKLACSHNKNAKPTLLKELKKSFSKDRSSKCDKASIMCSSRFGVPQTWHYDIILRRSYL